MAPRIESYSPGVARIINALLSSIEVMRMSSLCVIEMPSPPGAARGAAAGLAAALLLSVDLISTDSMPGTTPPTPVGPLDAGRELAWPVKISVSFSARSTAFTFLT
jgi:hypothetical protein